MRVILQKSDWIDFLLQVYEPSVVQWPRKPKPASMNQMIVGIDLFEGVKSKVQLGNERLHADNVKVEKEHVDNAQDDISSPYIVNEKSYDQHGEGGNICEQKLVEELEPETECSDSLSEDEDEHLEGQHSFLDGDFEKVVGDAISHSMNDTWSHESSGLFVEEDTCPISSEGISDLLTMEYLRYAEGKSNQFLYPADLDFDSEVVSYEALKNALSINPYPMFEPIDMQEEKQLEDIRFFGFNYDICVDDEDLHVDKNRFFF